jgi:hypothetical protein
MFYSEVLRQEINGSIFSLHTSGQKTGKSELGNAKSWLCCSNACGVSLDFQND